MENGVFTTTPFGSMALLQNCLGVWGVGWVVTGWDLNSIFFRPELIWIAMPHVQIHSPHGDYQILGTKSSLAHWKTMGENLAQLTDIDIHETLRKRNQYILPFNCCRMVFFHQKAGSSFFFPWLIYPQESLVWWIQHLIVFSENYIHLGV